MQDDKTPWWIVAVLACVVAAGYWFQRTMTETPEPVQEQPLPVPGPAESTKVPAAPAYPIPEPAYEDTPKELKPLPALDDSDRYFKMELVGLVGEKSADNVVSANLIPNLVATIDNLPRPKISERIRALAPLDSPFVAKSQAGGDRAMLDDTNFHRYDALIDQFIAADLDKALELYRRYYPLFQKAYEDLGYPNGYFNDRLVEVIDHLLATPDVEGPIEVVRPNVLYEYADPGLQELSAGQKLLLRVGQENRARIKDRLRELRTLVVEG